MPDRRGDPLPGRWPGSITSNIAAHSAPSRGRAETELGQPGWTQSLAGHPLAAVGATQGLTRRQPGAVPVPCTTDSDGTCRAAGKHPPRLSPAGQGCDFRQKFPCDDPLPGPGALATSECQNSSMARAPARAVQVLQHHCERADPTATSRQPSGPSGDRTGGHIDKSRPPP